MHKENSKIFTYRSEVDTLILHKTEIRILYESMQHIGREDAGSILNIKKTIYEHAIIFH